VRIPFNNRAGFRADILGLGFPLFCFSTLIKCTAEPTLLCTLESKGWKLEVAQISGNAHTFIIRYYLMSKVATKEELEAGITGVTEK